MDAASTSQGLGSTMAEPVYIVSAARTAIGDFGGALKEFAPAELATRVIQEAVTLAGLQPGDVQHVVLGQVIPSEPHDAYIACVAAVNDGLPIEARSAGRRVGKEGVRPGRSR